ncbi:hypothetical protein B0T16DRAFT_411903 [Cercophora newfieldiana]|uniref:Uncharacterized protein n=1 Tax=Cercophora newfieldiana TaxID=92897 RepID=A0AA40CPB0_9PEZI|nr:hypothetical protein B0T16DRAFT_411903 [Cercophora newfieldiana]
MVLEKIEQVPVLLTQLFRLPTIASLLLHFLDSFGQKSPLDAMSDNLSGRRNEISHDEILVPLYFLDRDELWDTVKPYSFHYIPKEDIPLHNLLRSTHTTRIRSMRQLIPQLSLDSQGFEVHTIETKMSYSDFHDEKTVESVYVRELEDHLKVTLAAKEVRALDFQLRLRDAEFPYFGGKPFPKPQPSLMTHVDVTPDAAEGIVRELYGEAADEILKSRFRIITIWRPLRVPVRDWPLALCDATTVHQDDFIATDVIYPNYQAENWMLHFDGAQEWYWLPDQSENEVFVFKAVDSEKRFALACPHGAFPLAEPDNDTPARESIDVRLLVMDADIEYPKPKPWSTRE